MNLSGALRSLEVEGPERVKSSEREALLPGLKFLEVELWAEKCPSFIVYLYFYPSSL